MTTTPPQGNIIYSSSPWKIYEQDAGMGERDYAVMVDDIFYCRTEDSQTAMKIVEAIRSRPTPSPQSEPSYTHSEKMALRKLIHTAGEPFYKSLADIDNLQNIAGEFMSLNEDWCILYPNTYGYDDRTKTGFSQNQKAFIERVASIIRDNDTAIRNATLVMVAN